ncbi:hypothetical protein NBT05_00115 [Aquimarina sp. ERC-38]|uniref:hypothetical protein n=1 Tax=Aquimarina sp. ERC-38 TaxID=2949996 RepID=UPI0022461D62|nr:hypothetical protein [Aquimarina sp. ERC-38]UZO80907.1 hypothetical protein NBT05_00115 [Aquimarina sp. ERC-38]
MFPIKKKNNNLKARLFLLWVMFTTTGSVVLYGQYDINSFNYGISANKLFAVGEEIGVGVRAEYAFNCATTFLAEVNRSILFSENNNEQSYNEVALGINLILFNWYPTTITAGMGYIGNDASFFEEIEEDAYLSFITGSFNHGAQIKIRALYQVSPPLHIFIEGNVKSLGRRFDTVAIGFNFDFYKF